MPRTSESDLTTSAPLDPVTDPPRRMVTIEGTEIPVDPQTGRPQPGSIINQGKSGDHKVKWTDRDIKAKYENITNYNFTGITKVTFNGVRYRFPGNGVITLPSVIWDIMMDAYHRRNMAPNSVGSRDRGLAVGALPPRSQD